MFQWSQLLFDSYLTNAFFNFICWFSESTCYWNGDLDILFSELTFIGISFLDKPNVIFEEAPWMLMRVSMYGTLRASDFYNTVSENYELSVHEDIE